jgi:hypothetical protein
MVRRRCRLIVVSDAGHDPNFRFEDVGNAVRKISLDLGITITFRGWKTSSHDARTVSIWVRMRRIAPSVKSTIRLWTAFPQRESSCMSNLATMVSKVPLSGLMRLRMRHFRMSLRVTSFSASRSSKATAHSVSRSSTVFSIAFSQAATGRANGAWMKSRRHWRMGDQCRLRQHPNHRD